MNLFTAALRFAAKAHDGQQRKYTGAPYITHPMAVAEIVRSSLGTDEMVAAALLHDVVEDTLVPIEVIRFEFGPQVAKLVEALTDVPMPGVNREGRKAAALARLSAAPASAQTIKVADLIDNTSSIVQHDPKFARVYLREKLALLDALDRANPVLVIRARLQIEVAQDVLNHA